MSSRVCVAAVQMSSGQSVDANLNRAEALLLECIRQGATLIALPENFSFLDREGDKLEAVEDFERGRAIALLRSMAKDHGVVIVGGSVPLQANDKVTNTCLVFGTDGGVIAHYDKIHLFDIQLDKAHDFQESRFIAPGREVVTFDALGHTMGLSICYDLRFPELYRMLVERGARVLFVPSAFTWRTGAYHWTALLRARAIENLCYVVAPAQQGQHNPRRESFGHSMIIDPWGQILAQAPDREGIICAELDFEYQDQLRQRLPCLQHKRLLISDVYRDR